VKLRGYRIELGEVGAVLQGYEGIRQVVVIVRDQRLWAYYVSEGELGASDLRSYVQGYLPAYMVPVHYIWLSAMPLTGNGKIDKAALPSPAGGLGSKTYVAPRTALEEQLSKIWREVLGLDRVGMEDNFFEIGGHSLSAIQVISRIYRDLSVRLELRDLFLRPTLSELHEEIEIFEWAKNTPPGDANGTHREQILL
jgi:acyl carrier protein